MVRSSALDLIGETLSPLEATAQDTSSPVAAVAGKVAEQLRSLETYVAGHAEIIIDYATARRFELPISTATTEGTAPALGTPQVCDGLVR
jgi:hypothetical protein